MRLIVETGAGIPESNSYINYDDIEKYLISSNLETYENLTADEKIDRMVIASLFIDTSFNWIGRQKTIEQGLTWPRVNVIYQNISVQDSVIPVQIKKACVMALQMILDYGIGIFQDSDGAEIKKEKLGPLETEYFESLKIESANSSRYSGINNLLKGFYIKPNGNMITAGILIA